MSAGEPFVTRPFLINLPRKQAEIGDFRRRQAAREFSFGRQHDAIALGLSAPGRECRHIVNPISLLVRTIDRDRCVVGARGRPIKLKTEFGHNGDTSCEAIYTVASPSLDSAWSRKEE